MNSDLLNGIYTRRSVRTFTGEPVTKEDLMTILRAGMSAPSAVNVQPWAFVAVTDRSLLDALCRELPYAKMLDRAGAAIVVCGIPAKAHLQKVEYAVIDGTCASENILLAVSTAAGSPTVAAAIRDELAAAIPAGRMYRPDARQSHRASCRGGRCGRGGSGAPDHGSDET